MTTVLFIEVFVMLIVIGIIIYYYMYGRNKNSLESIKDKNGTEHLVRDFTNKEDAANLMAEVKTRIKKLLKHLNEKYPTDAKIQRLTSNLDLSEIKETDMNDSGTSYSINKGSELSLCLRDKDKTNNDLHELNLIMFVTLHELSHLMSKSYGHNDEFGSNFVFILKNAIDIGIYSNTNYEDNNQNYCGIEVTSNPLF